MFRVWAFAVSVTWRQAAASEAYMLHGSLFNIRRPLSVPFSPTRWLSQHLGPERRNLITFAFAYSPWITSPKL